MTLFVLHFQFTTGRKIVIRILRIKCFKIENYRLADSGVINAVQNKIDDSACSSSDERVPAEGKVSLEKKNGCKINISFRETRL